MNTADERVLQTLTIPGDLFIRTWAWSSDALFGERTVDGAANIWRVPIDGLPPVQLTRFGPEQLSRNFAYTADGARLLFFRQESTPGEVLQFRNFR